MTPEDADRLVQEYERSRPMFDGFAVRTIELLRRLLTDEGLKPILSSRTKDPASLRGKLLRPTKAYERLNQITDLCGLRVVVQDLGEIERVCALTRREFSIDEVNSLDKGADLEEYEFGYQSVHLIVSPHRTRNLLP